MTSLDLLPQILSLSQDDQLKIVEAIRIHLAESFSPTDKAAFNAELERRLADARLNPQDEAPLDVVIDRLRKKR